MEYQSFVQIRTQFPGKFLVLVDYEDRLLAEGSREILGAKDVQVFESGSEMLEVYRDLRRNGRKAIFCTPEYQERFIIQRVPTVRIMG